MLIRLDGALVIAQQEVGDGVQEVDLEVGTTRVRLRVDADNSGLLLKVEREDGSDLHLRASLD